MDIVAFGLRRDGLQSHHGVPVLADTLLGKLALEDLHASPPKPSNQSKVSKDYSSEWLQWSAQLANLAVPTDGK